MDMITAPISLLTKGLLHLRHIHFLYNTMTKKSLIGISSYCSTTRPIFSFVKAMASNLDSVGIIEEKIEVKLIKFISSL